MFGFFKKKKNDEITESMAENENNVVEIDNEDDEEEFEGEILEFFEDEYQEYWRNEIKRSDWDCGQELGAFLEENKLKEIYGDSTKIYMLADGESLLAYCVLSEKYNVECENSPWISYVYTSASNRNKGYAKMIIDHACGEAKANGADKIYAATNEASFAEKMNFTFEKEAKNHNNQTVNIYSKIL